MCEETDVMLIVFFTLILAGVYLDLWVREALLTLSNFRITVNFYRFKRVGLQCLAIKLAIMVKTTSARANSSN